MSIRIVEAAISREEAQTTLVEELLNLFGGRPKPVMARLVESGRLTLDDIKEAEDALKKLLKKALARHSRAGPAPPATRRTRRASIARGDSSARAAAPTSSCPTL